MSKEMTFLEKYHVWRFECGCDVITATILAILGRGYWKGNNDDTH